MHIPGPQCVGHGCLRSRAQGLVNLIIARRLVNLLIARPRFALLAALPRMLVVREPCPRIERVGNLCSNLLVVPNLSIGETRSHLDRHTLAHHPEAMENVVVGQPQLLCNGHNLVGNVCHRVSAPRPATCRQLLPHPLQRAQALVPKILEALLPVDWEALHDLEDQARRSLAFQIVGPSHQPRVES